MNTKRKKTPWPTKDAMVQIYEKQLWGGKEGDFYSGEGSHHPEIVVPYVDALISFLTSFKDLLTVCDLGCGDFNIGRQLREHTKKYIAVDIVPNLIERNSKKYTEKNLEFHCLDIAVDVLPEADCAIVRQVLQHLSNAEVERIAKKLQDFKYVVLTEHLPKGNFIPNKDLISGQGIRLKQQSGLDLLAPPFNFIVKEEKQLLSITPTNGKGVIVTNLYRVY